MVACAAAVSIFALAYGLSARLELLLALVPLHGVFWSGLLTAASAHMAEALPDSRRAEGLGYWGFSTVLAVAIAPSIGFWGLPLGLARAVCAELAVINIGMGLAASRLMRGAVGVARTQAGGSWRGPWNGEWSPSP